MRYAFLLLLALGGVARAQTAQLTGTTWVSVRQHDLGERLDSIWLDFREKSVQVRRVSVTTGINGQRVTHAAPKLYRWRLIAAIGDYEGDTKLCLQAPEKQPNCDFFEIASDSSGVKQFDYGLYTFRQVSKNP